MINQAKSDMVIDKLEEYKGNPNKFWKELNRLLKIGEEVCNFNLVDDKTGDPILDKEAADYINDFFANVGKELYDDKVRNGLDHERMLYTRDDSYANDAAPINFAKREVDKLIKGININKPSGIANLNSRVLKDALSCMSEQLTHLFQRSFSSSAFPTAWAKAFSWLLESFRRN